MASNTIHTLWNPSRIPLEDPTHLQVQIYWIRPYGDNIIGIGYDYPWAPRALHDGEGARCRRFVLIPTWLGKFPIKNSMIKLRNVVSIVPSWVMIINGRYINENVKIALNGRDDVDQRRFRRKAVPAV